MALARADDPEREHCLRGATWSVTSFRKKLAGDPPKIKQLVEITSAVRSTTGAGRTAVEAELMQHLTEIARQCGFVLEDAGVKNLTGFDAAWQVPAEAQPAFATIQILCHYALDCLLFIRPQDSASGQRRESAFRILANAGRLINLPEVVTLASKSLHKVNSREVQGAFLFFENYYASRDDAIDDEIVDQLFAVSEATSSRHNAWGALSLLVKLEELSEFGAEDHMNEWKEKHERW